MLIVSYKDVSYSEAALSETCLVKQIPSSGQSPEAQSARHSKCVFREQGGRTNSSGRPDKPPARASALQSLPPQATPPPPLPASACVITAQAGAPWTCQLPRPVFLLQRAGIGVPAGLVGWGGGAGGGGLSVEQQRHHLGFSPVLPCTSWHGRASGCGSVVQSPSTPSRPHGL